jgi:hypothetical protein
MAKVMQIAIGRSALGQPTVVALRNDGVAFELKTHHVTGKPFWKALPGLPDPPAPPNLPELPDQPGPLDPDSEQLDLL